MSPEVLFESHEGTFRTEARDGESLLEAARRAGLLLDSKCGGRGVCKGCLVHLVEGSFTNGTQSFEVEPGEEREVRSCQVQCRGDGPFRVVAPKRSLIEQRAQIDESFVIPTFDLSPVIRRVSVPVAEATLQSPIALEERLASAAEAALGVPVEWRVEALRQVSEASDGGTADYVLDCYLCSGKARVLRVGGQGRRLLGLALDIGTTTVVAALLDMASGEVLAKASRYNQQVCEAEDVASRISVASGAGGLARLHELVIKETIEPLIAEVLEEAGELQRSDILAVSASGNTVMMHLLAGVSPWSIGRAPFEPTVHRWPALEATDIGLEVAPGAPLLLSPSISGYVGGDLVADLYSCTFLAHPEASLLIDIGTNGEIVFGENGRLGATATAAGPAFEGFGVSCGQRAARGAVERVRLKGDGDVSLRTIGNTAPTGLCGSAIIDFVAEAFRAGFLNSFGRFDVARLKAVGRLFHPYGEEANYRAFLLQECDGTATGKPLFVSEADVAQVLKAKAAIYAGARRLLAAEGRSFSDIRRYVLAGGFARHIDIENAVTIGLLPDIPRDRYVVIGNGSLAGAVLLLLEERCGPVLNEISRMPETLELNLDPEFEDDFADALAIPNLNLDEFPSVQDIAERGDAS